jgi:hypothetical protein
MAPIGELFFQGGGSTTNQKKYYILDTVNCNGLTAMSLE